MRRRDQAEIAPHGPVAAHGQNLAVLQHPQQLDLQSTSGMSATSSRKSVPPSACSRRPCARVGAGERSRGVAEQLALGQRRAQRGDVDRHERSLAAPAVAMDRPGNEFLAGAAFAAQMDAGVGRGNHRNPLEHLLDRRR